MEQVSSSELLNISGNKDVPFNTRISELDKRLYFHSLIKESVASRHFIVEDITNLSDRSQPVFYYLKQTVVASPKQHNHAMRYFAQFLDYCKSPFAKSEIAKLVKVHHYENYKDKHFELVLLFEYGDADRIDIAIIEPEQILRFIKNICLLLHDVQKFNDLAHGNLHLKNIVLCDNELKISGFKPIWTDNPEPTWKASIVKRYGGPRLDLFGMGLVWLNFLDADLGPILCQDREIKYIEHDLLALIPTLPNVSKRELLARLLGLSEHPTLGMEAILLEFDEYFVLKTISNSKEAQHDDINLNNSFKAPKPDLQVDMSSRNSGKVTSEEQEKLNFGDHNSNLFTKQLRESENNMSLDIDKRSADLSSPTPIGLGHYRTASEFVLNEQFSVIHQEIPNSHDLTELVVGKDGSKQQILNAVGRNFRAQASDNHFASQETPSSTIHGVSHLSSAGQEAPNSTIHRVSHLSAPGQEVPNSTIHRVSHISVAEKTPNPSIQVGFEESHLKQLPGNGSASGMSHHSDVLLSGHSAETDTKTFEYSISHKMTSKSKDKISFNANVTQPSQTTHSEAASGDSGTHKKDSLTSKAILQRSSERVPENPEAFRISDKLEAGFDRMRLSRPSGGISSSDVPRLSKDLRDSNIRRKRDDKGISESVATAQAEAKTDFKKKTTSIKMSIAGGDVAISKDKLQKKNSEAQKQHEKKSSLLEKLQKNPIVKPESQNNVLLGENRTSHASLKPVEGFHTTDVKWGQEAEFFQPHEADSLPKPIPSVQSVPASHYTTQVGEFWVKDRSSHGNSTVRKSSFDKGGHQLHKAVNTTGREGDSSLVLVDVLPLKSSRQDLAHQTGQRQTHGAHWIPVPTSSMSSLELKPLVLEVTKESTQRSKLVSRKLDEVMKSPDKTLSNLPREVVERAMLRRQAEQALKLKSEKSFKHQKEQEKVWTERQNAESDRRINEVLVRKLQERLSEAQEKNAAVKRHMAERLREKNRRDEELIDRLKRRAEEKYNERKHNEFENWRNKRDFLDNVAKEHEPFDEFKVRKLKQTNEAQAQTSPLSKKLRDLSVKTRHPPIKRDRSENVLAPVHKESFNLTSIADQDKQFAYNHFHHVMRIPFRKVVEKFDEAVAVGGKETGVRRFHKTMSASAVSKKDQRHVIEKFEDTLRRYKEQTYWGVEGMIGDAHSSKDPQALLRGLESQGNVSEKGSKREFNTAKYAGLIDEAAFTSKLKSVSGENSQFFSLGKRNFRAENSPNELDFSHIRHVDFRNQALPNPVKEFKDVTLFRNDQVHVPQENEGNAKLKDFAMGLQKLVDDQSPAQVTNNLTNKQKALTGKELIEYRKIAASAYFAIGEYDLAKDELLLAVENVRSLSTPETVQNSMGPLILNLAFMEFINGDIPDSLEMLNHPDAEKAAGSALTTIKGNVQLALNRPKGAREAYLAEIKTLLAKEPKLSIIMQVYQLVGKVLETYRMEKDKMGPATFFQAIEGQIQKISRIYLKLEKKEAMPYEGILDLLVMRFLAFGSANGNFGMMNFVLGKSLKNKTLSPPAVLSPVYRDELCKYVLSVGEYLKAKPNYGGFEKNYNTYMALVEKLVGASEVSMDSLKTTLVLLFDRGVTLIQRHETADAQAAFTECFQILKKIFELEEASVFQLIDNMAKTLLKNKDFDNAAFFYEEFKKLGLQTPEILEKADLRLAKVHFWGGKFDRCAAILGPFLRANLFSSTRPDLDLRGLKYLVYFRMATLFSTPETFDFAQQALERKAIFTRHPVFLQYTVLLRAVASFVNSPGPVPDNAKILQYLDVILRRKSSIPLEKGSEILEFVSVIFSKFSKEHLNMLHQLKGDMEDSRTNVEWVCEFISNALFCVTTALKTHPNFSNMAKFEQHRLCGSAAVREEIRQTVQNNWDITEEIEGQYVSLKVNELKNKIANELLERNSRLKKREFKVAAEARPLADALDNAQEILRRSHLKRDEWDVSAEDAEKYMPTKLIEQFLRQLKNMMYLDVTEDILTYYNRFEAIVKEKNWNWSKFSYIPLLFNFFKQSSLAGELDRMRLLRILDEVFLNLELCVNDLKMLVLLLESFKDVQYLEVFVMYLHRVHPKLASLVFNWVFLENFVAKFDSIVGELFGRLYAFQFHAFENFSLMHFLNFESVLEIDKGLSFRIYRRHRYELLADERFKEVFMQYIDAKALQMFYFRHATYRAIVTLFKQPGVSQAEVLRAYQAQLFNHTQNLVVDGENYAHFVYEFFLLVNFVNLRSHPAAGPFVLEIANHLKRKIVRPYAFHFAVLLSSLGNYFFKFKMFRESVRLKTMALECLQGVEGEALECPDYVARTDLKSLLFSILSFLYLDFVQLEDANQAAVFSAKLFAYDYENQVLNLEKNLLLVLSLFLHGNLDQAISALFKCKQELRTLDLQAKLGQMFQAAVEKLDLLISEQVDPAGIVDEKRRRSRQSISTLLGPV